MLNVIVVQTKSYPTEASDDDPMISWHRGRIKLRTGLHSIPDERSTFFNVCLILIFLFLTPWCLLLWRNIAHSCLDILLELYILCMSILIITIIPVIKLKRGSFLHQPIEMIGYNIMTLTSKVIMWAMVPSSFKWFELLYIYIKRDVEVVEDCIIHTRIRWLALHCVLSFTIFHFSFNLPPSSSFPLGLWLGLDCEKKLKEQLQTQN